MAELLSILERVKTLVSKAQDVEDSLFINVEYWKNNVIAWRTTRLGETVTHELYSKEGIVLKIVQDKDRTTWELGSLHSQYCGDCVCGEEK